MKIYSDGTLEGTRVECDMTDKDIFAPVEWVDCSEGSSKSHDIEMIKTNELSDERKFLNREQRKTRKWLKKTSES